MRRLFASLFVVALLSIPAFAACAEVMTVGSGQGKTVLVLTDSYVINGVQFCEYSSVPSSGAASAATE